MQQQSERGCGGQAWMLAQGMCYKMWVLCCANRSVGEVALYQINMARK